MQKTKFHSYKKGMLAKGCELCVQGKKTVLFITGICSKHCIYCPISDQKHQKDVIYANEWKIDDFEKLCKEIRLCESEGVGITGGDPLCRLERTIDYIRKLKKQFGKSFHIHLYTPLDLVNEKTLLKLYQAGLDEIRFHPETNKPSFWNKILLAKKFKWEVGVEIPCIPGTKKDTIELINYLDKIKIDFLNINELEISDTNAQNLIDEGFRAKDNLSYGVKGSEKLALELLKYCKKRSIPNVHYCTTTLKDRVQLAKRIKLRSKNAKKPFDKITSEGLFIRGALYLPKLAPSFGYKEKIRNIKNRGKIIKKLKIIRKKLIIKHKIPREMIFVDQENLRILTSTKIVKKINTGFDQAIVTEYPTMDAFIIEIDMIRF